MSDTSYPPGKDTSHLSASFADRLALLVDGTTVSAFARKVGLSESLIRKYLKGSEPSLSRADQIARMANVSLEWLATGCGYQYRQAEVVDQPALVLAESITADGLKQHTLHLPNIERMTLVVSVYQFLRTHKKSDGYLDEYGAQQFARHAIERISAENQSS
jgi:transcriptional regulator with XRE-family HTH domain